ncbi:MAG: asparagine synthase (glutamine-hydrolyzing) [Thiofilum sp.]|uniref:asparagine synthase (glutamine-hydrolyzing) n=1 Tax=Thiofilum sp. TaxID=2212733 RepID=UPI0025CEF901|nr:asparagine synthase (glutamine-hydrolyzing) [Thiofilum sp.]MBK8451881.1 asparagine synthase (glutamine-hydrolyzing) [Thiofilum sp.]
MCGIAGIIGHEVLTNELLSKVLHHLAQRGPDAQQWQGWDADFRPSNHNPHLALLHTRLSIRDLSVNANQPMSNNEGTIWLCYNGEVYGWEQDAEFLKQQGFIFKSYSDTEFILHAYHYWGLEGLIPRLRGMFAIAILDLRSFSLYLLRDRMGLKPIVYHHSHKGFAFASTVRTLLPWLPKEAKDFSSISIDAYLAHRYIPAPHTLLQGVKRLENGHYLRYDLKQQTLTQHCYWQIQPSKQNALSTTVLDEAIQLRTVADRPVGLFLSGGVDSSVLAQRLASLGFSNIQAFTARFLDSYLDESKRAEQLANHLNMPQVSIDIPTKIEGDFSRIVADLDEPFADPSSFPLWYLSKAATQSVKVVLNGDGGDELFAGYKRYQQHMRSAWRGEWRLPLPKIKSIQRKGISKIWNEIALSWVDAYSLRFSGFNIGQRIALQPDLIIQPHYWRIPSAISNTIDTLLAIDQQNYLPEYILRKADLMTMAHGLEGRSPLLDHYFVQTVIGLSAQKRFTQPPKKALVNLSSFPEALNPILQKKYGFNPPLDSWLHNDLSFNTATCAKSLAELTNQQISFQQVQLLLNRYYAGEQHLAEQVLQLYILNESLLQFRDLV